MLPHSPTYNGALPKTELAQVINTIGRNQYAKHKGRYDRIRIPQCPTGQLEERVAEFEGYNISLEANPYKQGKRLTEMA